MVLRGTVAIAALLHLGHFLVVYRRLPARVVSHIGTNGPDAWSSRESFIAIMMVGTVLINLFLIAMPWFIRRLPEAWLNLPNKDYWLSPGQRGHTFQYMTRLFLWLTLLTMIMISGLLEAIAWYSHHPEGSTALLPLSIVGYTLLVMILAFQSHLHFSRADRHE